MEKIYFNNDGWVCNRYPYNLQIENENSFIDVSQENFEKTLSSQQYFAWRVQNGSLLNERYEETPTEELLQELRLRREQECFSVVNRGQFWYDSLNFDQKQELQNWNQAWLNVTETKIIPAKPVWLN